MTNSVNSSIVQINTLDNSPETTPFLNARDVEKVTKNNLLNHALHYAKLGYPVFPLHNLATRRGIVQCSCRSGIECDRVAKHPRTRFGHTEATTDEHQIKAWWEKSPTANIGMLTGRETGIFVLDIDIKHGGEQSLENLLMDYRTLMKSKYSPLPGTLTACTGSGGRHLYFKHPLTVRINGSASVIGEGLDIRGDDNYIIVPPSRHHSGNEYLWFGAEVPIEDAPNWLLYEIKKREEEKATNSKNLPKGQEKPRYGEKVKDGNRNNTLCSRVCGLVNSFPREEVLRRALEMNHELFEPPLPERRIESTVNWAWNKFRKSKK